MFKCLKQYINKVFNYIKNIFVHNKEPIKQTTSDIEVISCKIKYIRQKETNN